LGSRYSTIELLPLRKKLYPARFVLRALTLFQYKMSLKEGFDSNTR